MGKSHHCLFIDASESPRDLGVPSDAGSPPQKKHEFSQCFPTPNKTKTQLPAPYMWQQKTRQQPKITKKPFASNELLVIQDLSLESLHDLRGHCYLLTPMEPLKGYTVNLIEYEPEYRNDRNYIEHDSMCTIENDKDRSGVNRSSSNFELLASVPIHQNWFCIDSIPKSVYFKIVLLLCDLQMAGLSGQVAPSQKARIVVSNHPLFTCSCNRNHIPSIIT